MVFPSLLNINPYLSNATLATDRDGSSSLPWYQLTSIVSHIGTAESGHYVCYVRAEEQPPGDPPTHRNKQRTRAWHGDKKRCSNMFSGDRSERWIKYNDDEVSAVTFSEVCKSCFGGVASECDGIGSSSFEGPSESNSGVLDRWMPSVFGNDRWNSESAYIVHYELKHRDSKESCLRDSKEHNIEYWPAMS
jgi:hypothetical protein